MTSISSQALTYGENPKILQQPLTTGTEGNTASYASKSIGGKSKKRKYKKKGGKTRGRRSNRKTMKKY